MDITTQDRAFTHILDHITKKDGHINNTTPVNKCRGRIVKTDKQTYFIIFKRERFRRFSDIFPHEQGLGESINKSVLDMLCNRNINVMYFIYPDYTYWIYPKLFKNYSTSRGLIRDQNVENSYKSTTGYEKIHETTCSVPFTLFQRVEDGR